MFLWLWLFCDRSVCGEMSVLFEGLKDAAQQRSKELRPEQMETRTERESLLKMETRDANWGTEIGNGDIA